MHSFADSGSVASGTSLDSKWRSLAWFAFASVTLLAIVHVAWICDDAFISARVVDNFLSFRGLRWNAAERVQAYTHPLWLLLTIVARAVGRGAYWSLLAVSVLTSAACVAVVAYSSRRAEPFLAVVAGTLALSKCFVEFSSSGLENPLTHLLLALLWVEAVRRPSPSLFKVSALAGLAALNRLDLLLLFIPPLLATLRAQQRISFREWRLVALAFSPLLAWQLFSLIYYGSLVPNTAIAKLETGVSRLELLGHGLAYVLQPSWNDPISLLLLLSGLPLGLTRGRGPLRALCLGATLYIGYVIWIGGDFMAGRFLSAPVLVAVLTLLELAPVPRLFFQVGFSAAALALEAIPPTPIWAAPLPASTLVEEPSASTCLDGVCDERAFYGPFTHWRRVGQTPVEPAHPWALRGASWQNTPDRTRIAGATGFRGFFAGPRVFIVDYFGLSDPLIARLPHDPSLRSWKPGHLKRCVPLGYPEAARLGPSALADAPLREYYQRIWLVTRGALWSRERWRAIWQLNTSASRFTRNYTCRPPTPVDGRSP